MSAPCLAVYAPLRGAVVIVDRHGHAVEVPVAEVPSLTQAMQRAAAHPALADRLSGRSEIVWVNPGTPDNPDDAREPDRQLPGAPVEPERQYGGSCHE